jgi:4-amino-4-deoxy-L-arabinose transferase-like glycosyltransferase
VVRLVHALWSLVVVRSGYRIALRISGNERIAWNAGLLLALFYFMPFLAVRQLVEVACIPLLMLGTERLLGAEPHHVPEKDRAAAPRTIFLAGVLLGLAVNVRFQTLFFAAGPGSSCFSRAGAQPLSMARACCCRSQ